MGEATFVALIGTSTMDFSVFNVFVATAAHLDYVPMILAEMEASAKARGTGIARRSEAYLSEKIREGKAIIAFAYTGQWAGFCYIESWDNGRFVSNSGLIVAPDFRKSGLAKRIKQHVFALSRQKFPTARIFSLTTGLAVMKLNSQLGYEPVTYSELPPDEAFWSQCQTCINHPILESKGRKNCLCTAMLFLPAVAAPVPFPIEVVPKTIHVR